MDGSSLPNFQGSCCVQVVWYVPGLVPPGTYLVCASKITRVSTDLGNNTANDTQGGSAQVDGGTAHARLNLLFIVRCTTPQLEIINLDSLSSPYSCR